MPITPLQEWLAAGNLNFRYRGHAIFTRQAGAANAPALLLIHGFPTASWDWESLWPELSQHYRVLTLDLLGFGYSAKPTDYAYSLMDQADLCEAFLRANGVQRYHVLAHDYGDSVAQELLARQRDAGERPKIASVALLNGGLFPETHRPVLVQRLLLSPIGRWIARLMTRSRFDATMRRIFGPGTQPDAALLSGFWTLMQHEQGRRVLPLLIRYMVERRRHRARWVGALQHASVPVALIIGMADPISGAHMVARYRELIQDPHITELPDIGHYPQCESPEAVLAAYQRFRLAQVSALR
jgi:pimeloyl-ACP methyl ester carboxylesterase